MLDLGDWQIGQEISIPFVATDGVSPAWPDAAPQLALFNGSTLIRRVSMPADSQSQIDGIFRLPVFLDNSFPASGPISGMIQWVNGGVAFSVPLFFRILPSGNSTGQIVSMAFVKRPSVGHLLYQADSGTILKATNPKVNR